jgi:hypothetical protein
MVLEALSGLRLEHQVAVSVDRELALMATDAARSGHVPYRLELIAYGLGRSLYGNPLETVLTAVGAGM